MYINVKVRTEFIRTEEPIESSITLREAFTHFGVELAGTVASVDGTPLSFSDMGKSFDELGLKDGVVLSAYGKHDNAASAQIVGNICVVKSSMTPDQITKVLKHKPDALAIFEGEGENRHATFRVSVAPAGRGSVSAFGIGFDSVGSDGCALVNVPVDQNVKPEDRKDWVVEHVGAALSKLKALERGVDDTICVIDSELASVASMVEVL